MLFWEGERDIDCVDNLYFLPCACAMQALDAKHPGLFDFLTVDAFGVLSHLEKVHSMSVTVPQY